MTVELSSYRVTEIPGKDLGVVATRDIALGELVIAEKPLCTACPWETEAAVAQLTQADRDVFFGLHFSGIPSPRAIFMTNALPVGIAPRGGIFPIICRINHSCNPNVNHSWNENIGKETIYAVRDITKGEEIQTSYCEEIFQPRRERMLELERKFRFVCQCQACKVHDSTISDERRVCIQELDDGIPNAILTEPVKAISMIKNLLKLLCAEIANTIPRSKAHYDAFQIFSFYSDFHAAKRHAGLAYANNFLAEGAENPGTQEKLQYFKHPTTHSFAGSGGRRRFTPTCDSCDQRGNLQMCSCCKCVAYCSKECQKSDWKLHKSVCMVVRQV